jgi:hypothetical protein
VPPLRRPGLVIAAVVAAIALPTVASGALAAPSSGTGIAANTTTYQDSVGEDAAAPDITTIVASNDDAGTISFKINVPNRAQLTQDLGLFMDVDSDANQATGDPQNFGSDYIIQLLLGEIILFKWDGTDYRVSATQSSLAFQWTGGPTVRINAADLGNTRKLSFDAFVVSGIVFDQTTGAIDCSQCKRDFAPGVGLYTYDVKVGRASLVVKSLKPTPAKPTAGKPFTLRLVAARSDTGAVVQNGRATCLGRIGSAKVTAKVQRVQGGAAVCTWNLPANAKGKTFRGSVSVAFEGLKASQSYAGTIR